MEYNSVSWIFDVVRNVFVDLFRLVISIQNFHFLPGFFLKFRNVEGRKKAVRKLNFFSLSLSLKAVSKNGQDFIQTRCYETFYKTYNMTKFSLLWVT